MNLNVSFIFYLVFLFLTKLLSHHVCFFHGWLGGSLSQWPTCYLLWLSCYLSGSHQEIKLLFVDWTTLTHSIAPIFSSIASRHFSSCTSIPTLRSFSAYNCSWNIETSCSSSKCCFYKAYFLLSKLTCRITLPLASFLIYSFKSPFAISNLWITSSFLHMSMLSELYRCIIELSNTCSSDLFDPSKCSTELTRLLTKLYEMFTCSVEISELSEFPINLSELFICSIKLINIFLCFISLFGISASYQPL